VVETDPDGSGAFLEQKLNFSRNFNVNTNINENDGIDTVTFVRSKLYQYIPEGKEKSRKNLLTERQGQQLKDVSR